MPARPELAAVTLPSPQIPAEEVDDTVRRVLERAEFQTPPENLLERALREALEWIGTILSQVTAEGATGVFAWAVVLVAVSVAAFLAFRFLRQVSVERGVSRASETRGRRSAEEWRRTAEEHEVAGRWSEAVRSRYRAMIAEMVARGLVDDTAGTTAGEYRRQVRTNVPDAAPAFVEATGIFEAAWYGADRADRDDARQVAQLDAHVRTALP